MSENSRIAKNTILLYIRMLAVMAVSLYTSRIVLQNLGVMDYGLYSVVGSVATMFVFLNSAMASVSRRFMSVEIGKKDDEQLKKVFNVSFIIHALLGLFVVLLCEIVGLWFIYFKMQIPEGRESAVLWTFQISMVITYFTMINVPFNALIISREKMGAFAYISIFDVLCSLGIAYLISVVHFDKLIFYALFIALQRLIVILIYFIYCKIKFAECSFRFYKFDALYKEMLVFAMWGLLGHFSVIITTSIQNMMLNAFFTPVVNAARAISMKVSSVVNNFNSNFQLSVEPQITISYAEGRRERTLSLINNSSRFSLYLMWLLSMPIILLADELLDLWLVEVPENTSSFVILILVNNMIFSTANALNMAIRAHGQIKYPELVGGVILVLNLPLSYACLKLGFAPQSVFWVMIICNIAAQVARVLFAYHYIELPVIKYVKEVFIIPVAVMILSMCVPYLICNYLGDVNAFLKVIIVGLISIISIFACVYTMGLSKEERILVGVQVNKYISKMKR